MEVNLTVPPAVTVAASGIQGPRGNAVLNGVGAPGPAVGIDGDYYINTANYPSTVTLYGPKATGTWPAPGVVVGGGGSVGALLAVNNLDDLADATAARSNLGLGTAAVEAASAFDPAGAAAAALAAAEAYTDEHSDGAPQHTTQVRIADDNLSGLSSAPTWTVVVTSAETPLQCSIAAEAGDRIELDGNFMYSGAHFLDWALLASDGSIAAYASQDPANPGVPLAEGNPTMYPSVSFSKATATDTFTVGPGNLNAGLVTVALAHQGMSAGTVYAHPLYPWKLRLKNIGPEPA